ncbi:MAG TPA: PadR family transcriptional regulator [Pseudonocardiaceae bacterium]|jgi:DNA-binding PadR family transcriptional regulator|nr:PadR family transcriptional regulator [Pseudonocardiaceae bacterium]
MHAGPPRPGRHGFPGGPRGFFGPGMPPGFGGEDLGFGFGPRGRGRGRHGGRARRGDVRAAVLTLLAERSMHGYEMIQEIGSRSGGIWRPSPGSVYPTLQLLADEGLVTVEENSGKRLYALTEAGRAEAGKLGDTPPWEQVAGGVDQAQVDLRAVLGEVTVATGQLAQAASRMSGERSTAAVAEAAKILTEARQKLYLILAEAGAGTDGPETDTADSDESEEG